MSATAPSPVKRPSIAQRSSSTHSLSSAGKQPQQQQQQPKVHRVTRHSRNVSHGKGLSKLGKVQPNTNTAGDQRNHQRKKSGPVTPGESPISPLSSNMKRNSSHVTLPKNTSYGNLRKNHSATALAAVRNRSHGNLAKLGAPQSQKDRQEREQKAQKAGVFDLGDHSSENDDDEEWEDSTNQSPELSRNVSKANTPLRVNTPNGERAEKPPDEQEVSPKKHPSHPESTNEHRPNRSAPNLRNLQVVSPLERPAEPSVINQHPRASRAPPAMSTVSAHSSQTNLRRTDSERSISKGGTRGVAVNENPDSGPFAGTTSSGSHGVSHFLPSPSVATSRRSYDHSDSDDDSTSGFLSNYRPQPSESPEKSTMLHKAPVSSTASRTQQKLDLQRREAMRAGASPGTAPGGTLGLGLGGTSSVSLHSRSGSKGRGRSIDDKRATQYIYETAAKQLTVVRRFRNAIFDSLHRLQEQGTLPLEPSSSSSSTTTAKPSAVSSKLRPQSRRGFNSGPTTPRNPISRSPEDRRTPTSQVNQAGEVTTGNKGKPARVAFQLAPDPREPNAEPDSQGQATSAEARYENEDDDEHGHGGFNTAEALLRRIWDSPTQAESDGVQTIG